MTTLPAGARLGPYEILAPIGAGGLDAGETGHFWPHFLPDGRRYLVHGLGW